MIAGGTRARYRRACETASSADRRGTRLRGIGVSIATHGPEAGKSFIENLRVGHLYSMLTAWGGWYLRFRNPGKRVACVRGVAAVCLSELAGKLLLKGAHSTHRDQLFRGIVITASTSS